jgi:polysaccharide biosynthesis protein PslG
MLRRQWPGVPVVLVRILCAAVLGGAILALFTLPTPALSTLRRHFTDPHALMFHMTGEESLPSQVRGSVEWVMGQFRPRPRTRSGVPVGHTDLPPFGVNTELEQEVEHEKRDRTLQMIAEAGFQWIRQPIPWYDIEIHGKNDFEDRRHEPYRSAWDKYDHIVDLAEAHDLGIIARLGAPPAWSRHDGEERGAFGPPDRIEDFADFAAAVATRYAGRVKYYQLWNEPNVYPEWGNQPVDPEAYTDLLCTAYHRIKAIDPTAVIISGAMAQTQELGTWNPEYQGNNMMDTVFLQRMYAAGAAACFDIMAVNDYMLWSGPTDQRLTQREINFSRPMWLRDIMVSNGDAHKPIWISEMNSNAAPEGIPDRYGRVTLEQQARWAPLAFERIQREWPWAGVTSVWFFKKATDAEVEDPSYYFRLLDPDFTPMPVYYALSTYFNDIEPTLYRGFHQETTWQVTYAGPWEEIAVPEAILGSYRRATAPGAAVTLAWEGRSLWLHPGPGGGTLRVRDESGNSRDLTLSGVPVRLDRSLLPDRREITLTALEGEVSVDAFEVR